ncbi:DUF7674 family protein [Nocardioides sp.]|uniref:DUF7674 family protein n=1 Tax=Nocardioides sp. TaxID=35761 RepID=UPI002C380DE2|nr:hypothetical protein [Nocardioides sp.]HXH78957.1 hypothetical protein [Nocardioides sp.]
MTSSEDLIHDMVREFPEFLPVLAEHIDDHDELLPYLLLGEVARWAHDAVSHDAGRVAELSTWLERRFDRADEVVQNLIAVGYVEMLPPAPEGSPLLALLGPSLYKEAEAMNLPHPWETRS